MSNRTIIEINHDFVHKIRDDRNLFVDFLIDALRSNTDEDWRWLEMFGVKRIVEAHHSDNRKVTIEGREYPIG